MVIVAFVVAAIFAVLAVASWRRVAAARALDEQAYADSLYAQRQAQDAAYADEIICGSVLRRYNAVRGEKR